MNFSNSVKLHPWVGSDYFETHPRILILGLSMHSTENNIDKREVISMVRAIRNEEWTYAFFTKIGHAFSNESHWYENGDGTNEYFLEKNEFWNSVAFYEYLHDIFNGPKEQISPKQFHNAQKPFLEVVEKLEPDIILTLGFITYENLPQMGEFVKTYIDDDLKMEVWKYKFPNKLSYVCRVQHPSSFGFETWKWGNLFHQFYLDFTKTT